MVLDFFEKLQPVFQPVVSLENSKIDHYEALLRFKNPDQAASSPIYKYIEELENNGKILDLDAWMLGQMVNKVDREPSYPIALNISGQTVSDPRYFAFANELLLAAKKPHLIQFEITETRPITALSKANEFIEMVNSFGCRVSVDDYGAGFATAHYLKNLAVDEVKIDGKYIRDIRTNAVNRAFVANTITIAEKRNLRTVAEFVEDFETMTLLKNMGIHCGQGYLFSKPQVTLAKNAEIRHNLHLNKLASEQTVRRANSLKMALSM